MLTIQEAIEFGKFLSDERHLEKCLFNPKNLDDEFLSDIFISLRDDADYFNNNLNWADTGFLVEEKIGVRIPLSAFSLFCWRHEELCPKDVKDFFYNSFSVALGISEIKNLGQISLNQFS